MLSPDITLRPEIKNALPKCAVAGCDELPTERLPDRMQVRDLFWCKPHADMLATMISKQDYRDFIEAFQQKEITKEPVLTNARLQMLDRRCCVPRCKGGVITGTSFEPYKQPGDAWTCDRHEFAVQYVARRLNGPRLINELARKHTRHKETDPEAEKRKTAIIALCGKLSRERDYIQHVCQALQRQRIPLLANWVRDWNRDHQLGLENWDWLVAYDSRKTAVRHRIQRYISSICNPRLRSHSKRQ
jgi:hypothetical protein